MKKYIGAILLFFIFILSGCSYSNWNLTKEGTYYPAQNDPVILEEEISNNSQIVENNQTNTEVKDRTNMFHINTVVSTWGAPNSVKVDENGSNNYIWQNCKKTGKIVQECEDEVCQNVAESICCDRVLITDEEGYVKNLKEAVANCM